MDVVFYHECRLQNRNEDIAIPACADYEHIYCCGLSNNWTKESQRHGFLADIFAETRLVTQ